MGTAVNHSKPTSFMQRRNRELGATRRKFTKKNHTAVRYAVDKFGARFTTGTIMGEEKPDEELMGKRKSSPRLSSTSPLGNADILSITV